jgi:hypothetical protein
MDYLVLKQTGDPSLAEGWEPTAIVRGLSKGAEEVAALQGYTGDGSYKAIPWPDMEGSAFDLGQGPPVATPMSEGGGE